MFVWFFEAMRLGPQPRTSLSSGWSAWWFLQSLGTASYCHPAPYSYSRYSRSKQHPPGHQTLSTAYPPLRPLRRILSLWSAALHPTSSSYPNQRAHTAETKLLISGSSYLWQLFPFRPACLARRSLPSPILALLGICRCMLRLPASVHVALKSCHITECICSKTRFWRLISILRKHRSSHLIAPRTTVLPAPRPEINHWWLNWTKGCHW